MTQLDLDFQALTGLNYTISDIIENASTDEEKQKAYNFITWNIKQGRILEVPANATLVTSVIEEIKDLNIIESGSESEKNKYFTIKNIDTELGTISYNAYNTPEVYYSLNNGDWESWIPEAEITLNQNDSIRIKCNAEWNYPEDYDESGSQLDYFTGIHGGEEKSGFNVTFNFDVCGNIMSLLYGDNFENQTDISEIPMVFMGLFAGCETLINAANLVLPATTLSYCCYDSMFGGCTSLTTTPKLPATTLADYCYANMFYDCTSLITTPELLVTTLTEGCYSYMFEGCTSLTTTLALPATVLANYCYDGMFYDCTSLTTAPALSATILTDYCYNNMFYGCTSLTTAPELPATILVEGCYYSMFASCASLLTAPALPATTLADSCYQYMFEGCTSLTAAPALPATTLASNCYDSIFKGCTSLTVAPVLSATTLSSNCYQSMFQNCTSLTTAPMLPATTLANYCYDSMFRGCTALITVPELPATTLVQGCYNNMFAGCTSLTTAPNLPATTLANYCYDSMFSGCISLTTAPNLPATTLVFYCYSNMFNDCTSLVTAPELPVTTLVEGCYNSMFAGCTSLNYIKCLATDITASSCTFNWLENVSNTGTFIKANEMLSWTDGTNGIPSDWTVHNVWYNGVLLSSQVMNCSLEDDTYTFPTITIDDPDITYVLSSSDTSVVSIVNNQPNIIGIGSSTITVTLQETNTNKYSGYESLSYEVNVYATQNELYENSYLTFTALENTTFTFSKNALQYSLDDGQTWTRLAANTASPTVIAGNKILWKQTGLTVELYYGIGTFSAIGNFEASGNIMSLYYGDNFIGQTDLTGKDYAFYQLFKNNTKLVNAENLILLPTILSVSCYGYMFQGCTSLITEPNLLATTLVDRCYQFMFSGCTSLTTAPILPATTLAQGCYSYMFQGCTSLTTAPELPATTLAESCYQGMFYNCTNLTTTPELLATTLVKHCYNEMFYGCTSLNYIKCLATDITADNCTNNWVHNVSTNGTFVKADEMTSWTTGNNGIPSGWNIYNKNEISYLTFTALENTTFTFSNNALQYSLDDGQTWNVLAANTASPTINTGNKILWKQTGLTLSNYIGIGTFSATGNFEASGNIMSLYYGDNFVGQIDLMEKNFAFYQLFKNNTKLVNAANLILPATTLASYCYQNMFQNCTNLITAPALPATTLASYCYQNMFSSCTSLTTAPALPATILTRNCYNEMFYGCISLTIAPELPATTLAESCYTGMFHNCSSLTTAPALPATTLTAICYNYMFSGCTSLTTAPTLPASKLTEGCYNSIFSGCISLNYIKCLATDITASGCISSWVQNVSNTGTFIKVNEMLSWTTGDNGIPSGWTVQNNGWYYGASLSSQVMNCSLEDDTYTFPTITIDDPDVTYILSSSDTSVVSIVNNQPNIIGSGSSTITVTLQETNTNKYKGYESLSYEVNVYATQNELQHELSKISYLTFTALENTTFTFSRNSLQYSLDDGQTWNELAANSTTPIVNAGNKILWKQTGLTPNSSYGIGTFSATGNFEALGNIMSLYYGDNFVGQTDLTGKDYAFYNLFEDNTKLVNVKNLILPATTLASNCYRNMFKHCTNLTAAPELPATTLVGSCYRGMFDSCTSLNYIKCLSTNIGALYCTYNWVQNVSNTGTFIKANEMSAWTDGNNGIPSSWIVQNNGWYYGVSLSSYVMNCLLEDDTYTFPTITIDDPDVTYTLNSSDTSVVSIVNNQPSIIGSGSSTITITLQETNTNKYIGYESLSYEVNVYTQNEISYLTFTTLENTTFTFSNNALQYSIDDGQTWNVLATNTASPTVTAGNKIMWKQTGLTSDYGSGIGTFSATGNFEASGNIMSLHYGDNFVGQTDLTGKDYAFYNLFKNNTKLVNATNLVLPATALSIDCYTNMFKGCTALIAAPMLPATTLIGGCYESMFEGCTSLTTVPELPATILKSSCYKFMFSGCTSLTTTPTLPATTLAYYCYDRMFQNCTSLTTAPVLPATTLEEYCYSEMFSGCTSLTVAPELPATALAKGCYSGMFWNCTSLATAPKLLATTLVQDCYSGMFHGCTSLTTAPELPATTLVDYCYQYMFENCTSLTTAPELPATILVSGCYNSMFNGCTSINYIKCLATDISAYSCTDYWVQNVSATGTFVKADEMTSWSTGDSGIPSGWDCYNLTNEPVSN